MTTWQEVGLFPDGKVRSEKEAAYLVRSALSGATKRTRAEVQRFLKSKQGKLSRAAKLEMTALIDGYLKPSGGYA